MKSIAFVSDSHFDDKISTGYKINSRKNWIKILEDIKIRGVEQIIFGGDLGIEASIPWFLNLIESNSLKINLLLGNHDKTKEILKYYRSKNLKKDKKLYYFNEDQYIKYIYLDSSAGHINQTQLKWLDKELKTNKKIVIFSHYPILEVNTAIEKMAPLKARKNILDKLLKCNKDIEIFCGHNHIYNTTKQENIRQKITPAISYQVKKRANGYIIDKNKFGYLLLTITKTEIISKLIYFSNQP